MCSLYSLRKTAEEVRLLFNYPEQEQFPPRPLITPGSPIATICWIGAQRHFALLRWGLVPFWVRAVEGKPLVNARAETILERASFRHAMRRRRCLIPADGFYEWGAGKMGRKQLYHITRADGALFAFAGLWEQWQGADGSEIDSAAIITTQANWSLTVLGDRMPVIIAKEDFLVWLDADKLQAEEAVQLLRPLPDEAFHMRPVTLPKSEQLSRQSSAQLDMFARL